MRERQNEKRALCYYVKSLFETKEIILRQRDRLAVCLECHRTRFAVKYVIVAVNSNLSASPTSDAVPISRFATFRFTLRVLFFFSVFVYNKTRCRKEKTRKNKICEIDSWHKYYFIIVAAFYSSKHNLSPLFGSFESG